MTPLVWFIRSYDPYNRIGKYALEDIHKWADEGKIRKNIVFGAKCSEDTIIIADRPFSLVDTSALQ